MAQPMRARYSDTGIAAVLADDRLLARFDAIRAEFTVPEAFPPEVLAEADQIAGAPMEWPERDETAVPFLTIDPPGSMDLDQAVHIERAEGGFRVRYAIAYLPAFVAPGGAIDGEAHRRGQTIYAPDERTPLHPPQVSENAASLLPDQVRAAYVWDMHVKDDGEGDQKTVYRALVRSVDRFDYEQVQAMIDAGTDDDRVALLKEVGERRIAFEQRRGGASLPMPEQQVTQDEAGKFVLGFRPPLPAEEWNAQISLMTGMAAAELMVEARTGILRTLPAPDEQAVERFRRQAKTLGVQWQEGESYGAFLRRLDRTNPHHLALIYDATGLFRGSGYVAFDGEVPPAPEHGALASTYAHVTAPLRRLVDRFGLAIAEALAAGRPVPEWVRSGIGVLPEIMAATGRTASGVERACTDAVEAAVLSQYVGDTFDAVVVDQGQKGAWLLQLTDPAVVAHAGTEVKVAVGDLVAARLTEADVTAGVVRFHITARKGAVPAPAGAPAPLEDPLAPPA
ncbi:RNB domain-containing ribonuclease [Nostocoides australiense]